MGRPRKYVRLRGSRRPPPPMKRTPDATPFAHLLSQRLTRRRVLATGATLAPLAVAGGTLLGACATRAPSKCAVVQADTRAAKPTTCCCRPATATTCSCAGARVCGRRFRISMRRGLPTACLLEPGAAERQQRQFGTNCDAIHFFPLDARGERGILCVNNEYTLRRADVPGASAALSARCAATVASTSASIRRSWMSRRPRRACPSSRSRACGGRWQMVKDSRFNRRITAETPIDIGGPARGAALLRTQADPEGVRALGTFGNCAGGETPWGTYLTAEENIQDYFGNLEQLKARSDVDPYIVESHRRWRMWKANSLYALGSRRRALRPAAHADANRSASAGSSRSIRAIRRARRSSARRSAASRTRARVRSSRTTAASPCTWATTTSSNTSTSSSPTVASMRRTPRRTAICSIAAPCTPRGWMRAVAGEWLPLVFDPKGPLNAAAGFRDQAEVLIKARAAASVLGATPMDRTEDVEANPVSGRIYVACTRNEQRTASAGHMTYAGREVESGPDRANPRGANPFGHIIEIREAGDDHTAREFSWEVFLLGGDPAGGRLITDLTQVQAGQRLLRRLRERRRAESRRLAGQRRLRSQSAICGSSPTVRSRAARTMAAGYVRPKARSAAACSSS